MIPTKVNILGMELDRFMYESCTAEFGVGEDWATLYHIKSTEEGKGHADELLRLAKEYYKGKKIGGTVALHPAMRHLYEKHGYHEYV
jgi:hypothetical protein